MVRSSHSESSNLDKFITKKHTLSVSYWPSPRVGCAPWVGACSVLVMHFSDIAILVGDAQTFPIMFSKSPSSDLDELPSEFDAIPFGELILWCVSNSGVILLRWK